MKSEKGRNEVEKEQLQMISFQLISYAGDAFNHFYAAVNLAAEGKYDEAEEEIRVGDESLTLAHKSQTDLLTAEARQEDVPFSVILIHSQDHLMTTIMYERMAKQMIEMYKKINNK